MPQSSPFNFSAFFFSVGVSLCFFIRILRRSFAIVLRRLLLAPFPSDQWYRSLYASRFRSLSSPLLSISDAPTPLVFATLYALDLAIILFSLYTPIFSYPAPRSCSCSRSPYRTPPLPRRATPALRFSDSEGLFATHTLIHPRAMVIHH